MAKGHILVVDDEENILSSLEGILCDEGFQVSKAQDGRQALQIIRSDPPPDLVMLDIWIPGMDGLEVLQAAKELRSDLEVIMISGHGSIETAVKATKLGAFDFIEKPLSLDNVLLTVNHALGQQRLLRKGSQWERDFSWRGEVVGDSHHLAEVRRFVAQAAAQEENVLLVGEEGTGKEFIARAIHGQSGRREGPFVKVNCSHCSSTLMKGLLFGVQRSGGFSSIDSWGQGRLQSAAGGVLFLALVDELPLDVQHDLLVALREKKVRRIGSSMALPLDVRIIGSSSNDLNTRLEEGRFDRELAEELGRLVISTLPLRRRREDIYPLVHYFLETYSKELADSPKDLTPQALECLLNNDWPGNVKELKNTIKKAVLETPEPVIDLKDLPAPLRGELLKVPGGLDLSKPRGGEEDREKNGDRLPPQRSGRRKRTLHSRQRTLRRSVVLCGQGLHSGIKGGMILLPLPPSSGVHFSNISSGYTIPAHLDHVESTQYATMLKRGSCCVRTVEHLLAVLHIYGISNLLIKVNDEVPIMDGSAQEFCRLIEDGGLEEQEAEEETLVVDRCYTVGNPQERFLSIEPFSGLAIRYSMDMPQPIGRQEIFFTVDGIEGFASQIAPARTFVFLKDVEYLEARGLTKGGRLNNVILLDQEKVINTSLRFPDEFVRHKVLDILGDLYLLGKPVRGLVTARMTGHTENLQLLREIRHLA